MKNSLEGFKCRFEQTEETINLEDIILEIIESEEKKEEKRRV